MKVIIFWEKSVYLASKFFPEKECSFSVTLLAYKDTAFLRICQLNVSAAD